MKDFLFELDHYDGIDNDDPATIKFKSKVVSYINGGLSFKELNETIDPKWKPYLEVEALVAPLHIRPANTKMIEVSTPSDVKHSIPEIGSYVADRIGPSIFTLSKDGDITVNVHSGYEESLKASFDISEHNLLKVPSFYESWGITKFVDVDTLDTKSPDVFFNIPPILEYARHYSSMFNVNKIKGSVVVNMDDREKLKGKFQTEAKNMIKKLGVDDNVHIALGYQHRFEQVFGDPSSKWIVESSKTAKGNSELGFTWKLFHLTSKENPLLKTTILSIAANTTLWGEASRFLAEALVQNISARSLTFMGSAGLINADLLDYYAASVPKSFNVDGQDVGTKNFVYEFRTPSQQTSYQISWGSSHAQSNSPSEQTQAWLDHKLSKGIDTIDVEASLIAGAIKDQNSSGLHHTNYGVINLVTDKPGSHGEIDLNNISADAKRKGQNKILREYLSHVERFEKGILNHLTNIRRLIKKKLGWESFEINNPKTGPPSVENLVTGNSYHLVGSNPYVDSKLTLELIPNVESTQDDQVISITRGRSPPKTRSLVSHMTESFIQSNGSSGFVFFPIDQSNNSVIDLMDLPDFDGKKSVLKIPTDDFRSLVSDGKIKLVYKKVNTLEGNSLNVIIDKNITPQVVAKYLTNSSALRTLGEKHRKRYKRLYLNAMVKDPSQAKRISKDYRMKAKYFYEAVPSTVENCFQLLEGFLK
jgi:hypothetical protein